MIRTTFTPPHDLPTISLIIKDEKLIALDWHTQKSRQLLSNFDTQATFVPIDELNPKDPNHATAKNTITQLDAYFLGKCQNFDVPLALYGTPFQVKVWQTLLSIPYGQTISYKTLAERLGKPTAFRACANANGKNPISLIVPCHRVIASDGTLGGYTGGVDIKRTLLGIEGLDLS